MIEKKTNILVIVDMQNDFVSPEGSMAIKGADNLIRPIEDLQLKYNWDRIFYLEDYHLKTHQSFIENGGEFPPHCVGGTWGHLYSVKNFRELFRNKNKKYHRRSHTFCFSKGFDPDDLKYYCNFSNYFINQGNNKNFFLVGVATDYCVEAQFHHLKQVYPKANVYTIDELTLPIKKKPIDLNYISVNDLGNYVDLFKQQNDG